MSTGIQQWRNDGTPQNRRFADALAPGFFRIDDRSSADYLSILAAMAEKLRLDHTHSWRALLPDAPPPSEENIEDWQLVLAQAEDRRDNPPHLGLLIAFLRLYRHAQDHLNLLTGAHLDHYFRHVLGFRPRTAKPDHISIFPSLAKDVVRHLLPAGSDLDAGQDAEGNPLIYTTDSEIVVTQARVARVMAIHVTSGKPWLRITPVADSKDGFDAPFEKDELPMWPAFGPSPTFDSNPAEHLGFGLAISSPIFFLKEGIRTIRLTIGVAGMEWKNWKAYLTTTGKWLPVPDISGDSTVVTLTLDPKAPPVVAADSKAHPDVPPTDWPVLKLYAPVDLSRDDYKKVESAGITNVVVEVDRVTSLKVSNDFGPLDAGRPFQPFGPRPVVGSTFSVESEEMKPKTIKSWKPHFEWQGKPEKFVDYNSVASVTAGPSLPDSLFTFCCPTSDNPTNEHGLFSNAEISGHLSAIQLNKPPAAFGHSQYPLRVSDIATSNAAGIAAQTQEKPFTPWPLPPEPYTPTLKSFAISYRAEQLINDESIQSKAIRVFRLHPFGLEPVRSIAPLLPTCPEASMLFIGIVDGDPGSRLNLHFGAIEGSGKTLLEGQQPPLITWSYLSGEAWAEFNPATVEDGTGGLMQPGIISFEAMPGAVTKNPLMPPGLHWIRARASNISSVALQNPADTVCKLSAITAQAVRATLKLGDTVPVHLRTGSRGVLPAGSAKNLVAPDPAIASVAQPFTSYGGREAEDENGFYTRVSERLRHRHRAVTAWDYERLVLEAFPEIYKVLCVRAGPGEVKVVVVPRSARASWYDRLQPRPAPALRDEIERHLRALSSGMARVSVIDPDYEALQIACSVTFVKGKSPAAYRLRLIDDLQRFLTPWAYDDSQEIVFGGRIHQSIIQSFIDGRDYVEHFTGFKLVQNPSSAHGQAPQDPPIIEAKATHLWSILVSAREHLIHI